MSSQKGGALNVFGLLNLRGDLTSYQTTGHVSSQTVIDWLDDYVVGVQQTTVVVLDNAHWHRSKQVENKIGEWERRGMYLFFLPPYCPQRYAAPAESDRDSVEEGQTRVVATAGFRK